MTLYTANRTVVNANLCQRWLSDPGDNWRSSRLSSWLHKMADSWTYCNDDEGTVSWWWLVEVSRWQLVMSAIHGCPQGTG